MNWRRINNALTVLATIGALAVGMLAVGVAEFAVASHLHATKAQSSMAMNGKMASLSFTSPHRFGEFTLQPGTYRFQHRSIAGEHFMYFLTPLGKTVITRGVRCELELRPDKVRATAVTSVPEGSLRRITSIAIAGESVAHVFQPSLSAFDPGMAQQ
jgi:hypothetical protein